MDLAKNGVLKVGDILAYKRNFSALNLQIEKDVMACRPSTYYPPLLTYVA